MSKHPWENCKAVTLNTGLLPHNYLSSVFEKASVIRDMFICWWQILNFFKVSIKEPVVDGCK